MSFITCFIFVCRLVASFQCLGENYYEIFYKIKACHRSTSQIISSANFRSLERCLEFASTRSGLAVNYSPVEAANFRRVNKGEYFTNCQVLGCPENSYMNLINDTAYDYYSVYGNLTHLEDSICVKSIGLFRLFKNKENYTNAITKCQEIGGDLANVVGEKRTNSLSMLVTNHIKNWFKAVYVGLDDMETEGKFKTSSGDYLSCYKYRAWAPGHPRSKSKNEDCVILDSEKTWRVVKCKQRFPFLCEIYPSAPKTNNFNCTITSNKEQGNICLKQKNVLSDRCLG